MAKKKKVIGTIGLDGNWVEEENNNNVIGTVGLDGSFTKYEQPQTIEPTIEPINNNFSFTVDQPYTQKENKDILDGIGYVGASTGSGVVSGVTGIADAPLQYMQEGAEAGKNKSWLQNYIESSIRTLIDPFGITRLGKAATEIASDKNKSGLAKAGNIAMETLNTNAVTNSLKSAGQQMNFVDKNADKKLQKAREVIETPSNKLNQYIQDESQNYGKGWQIAGQVGQTVGNMAPSIVATAVTGNPNIGLGVMGVSAKGQATKEAEEQGATLSEANRIGYAKGAVEVGTELLTGGLKIFPNGALDETTKNVLNKYVKGKVANFVAKEASNLGGEVLEEVISDLLGTAIDRATVNPNATYSGEDLKNTVLLTLLSTGVMNAGSNTANRIRTGKSAYQINTEELMKYNKVQELVNQRVEQETTKDMSKQDIKKLRKQIENEVSQEIEKGLNEVFSSDVQNVKTDVENNIQKEENQIEPQTPNQTQLNTLNQGVQQENNQTPYQGQTSQITPLNEVNQELKETPQTVSFDTMNQELEESRLNDIEKSVKAFNLENEKQTQKINGLIDSVKKYDYLLKSMQNDSNVKASINSINSLLNERGIKAEFNDEYFKDKNGNPIEDQNAFWRIQRDKNGKVMYDKNGRIMREVILNPNANSKKTLENITIHEMFHDMFSDTNNKSAAQIYNEILDYARKNTNFDEARLSLENLYKDQYKEEYLNNKQKFDNLINEEAVADILGNKLGDTEFIESLVKQNRNIAQRIYDAIVSFLNKLNKKIGYKSEKVFWQDMKNKYAKALNTDYSNEVRNSNKKYSLIGETGLENLKDKHYNSYVKLTKALNEAKKMDSNKADNKKIWEDTGWYKDRNGRWKYEITDKNLEIKPNVQVKANQTYKLGDLINHDNLFKIYPELKDITVKFRDLKNPKANGNYNELSNTISISNKEIGSNKNIEGTLIHEIQHAIQSIEKFESGANSRLSKLRYYNSLGEIEASNVRDRFEQEKYKNYNLDYIEPLSVDPNAKHKNLNNYLKDRKITDKIKDRLFSKVGVDNAKSSEEIDFEDKNQNSRLVDGRGSIDNTSFSMQKDSQGRELSKQQQEYFKDSKARDDKGELEVVYHGSRKAGFTTFSTKDNVSFFTDNEGVANTYSGSNEKVDTRKLESLFDAKTWLKGINEDLYIENNKVYDYDGEEILSFDNQEDLLKNLKRAIQIELGNTEAGGIYKGYVNIKNPLIIEGDNNKWSQIPIDNIPLENVKELLKDQYYREKGKLRTSTNDIVRLAKENGNYDGVIFKNIIDEGMFDSGNNQENSSVVYATFNPNQFKAVDNLNPTEDPDIRYSQNANKWQEYLDKNFGNLGKGTRLSDIRDNTPLNSKEKTELDGLKALYETGLLETNDKEFKRMQELERRNNIKETTKALNLEKETKPKYSINESAKDDYVSMKLDRAIQKNAYKSVNKTTKTAENYLKFDREQKTQFKDSLKKLSTKTIEQLTNGKTYNQIKELVNNYANVEYNFVDEELKNIKSEIRKTKINIPEEIRKQITDYSDFRKQSKLNISKDGQNVDSIWQELSNEYPHIFSGDIQTEADMLYALSDLMNKDIKVTEKYRIPDSDLKYASDKIYNSLLDNSLSQTEIDSIQEDLQLKAQRRTRQVVQNELLKKMNITLDDLETGKDIKAINYQITDPRRVNEKVFSLEVAEKINDATVNFVSEQEAKSNRFKNKERQEIKDLDIKARSKESAAVQKYGEKEWINDKGELLKYGDEELAKEFPDVKTQEKIKNAAKELRSKYDNYIDMINTSLEEMGYDPIPKRKDYFKHFYEISDKLSQWGVPFNANDMSSDLLPTDINGLTDEFKPGKNWFASAQQRTGKKTVYDAITGIDQYLEGASNLIFHTESIQRYRTLSKLVRDTYGQMHGLDNVGNLSEEQIQKRIDDIQNNKLSGYAAWLDEQANAMAGKKGKIDRGVEEVAGRRIYSALNTLKKQVGSNMTGFNVRSAMTNFASAIQGMSKVKKTAFLKGTLSTLQNIIHKDGLIDKSNFLTNRFGSDSLSKKMWQKVSNAGQIFMTGTDYFTANQIWRSKYFENMSKGMTEKQAIKNADDFAARIMGDRSKGQTASMFNSKTLGFLTQFQLEVNNQWQSMIHDNKMDIKTGNKSGATVLFQLGQLAAMSNLFNTMMKSLTGSDVMFDPIDILKDMINPDDDDDKDIAERAREALGKVVNQLPMANIFTGGGRIPISEAFEGIKTGSQFLIGGKNKYNQPITGEDVKKDLLEALPYWIIPTGWGQLRKTIKGTEMYTGDKPVAGSYTDSGNLRFTADTSLAGKTKAALFGAYSSKEAQDYIKGGFKTITKGNNLDELKNLGYTSSQYKKYRQELNAAGTKNQDKMDYILSLDIPKKEKDVMASRLLRKDVDTDEVKKFDTLAEFNKWYKKTYGSQK